MTNMVDPSNLTDEALIAALRAMEKTLHRIPNGHSTSRNGWADRAHSNAGKALAAEAWDRGILNTPKKEAE